MPDPEKGAKVRAVHDRVIDPIRARARELGYAIGVHGSLARDIDLIAAPWTDEAVEARELAEAVKLVLREVTGLGAMIEPEASDSYHLRGCPGGKAHGRLCWSFYTYETYLDLSVMPRLGDIADMAVQITRQEMLIQELRDRLERQTP